MTELNSPKKKSKKSPSGTKKRKNRSPADKRKSTGTKKRKRPTDTTQRPKKVTKVAKTIDLSEWQVVDSDKGTKTKIIEVMEKDRKDTLLAVRYGSRLRCQVFKMPKGDPQPIAAKFTDPKDGSVYELVSVKQDEDKGNARFPSTTIDYKLMYVLVSGPGHQTLNLQESLDQIADFSSLSPRKIAKRLELLQSPAARLKDGSGYAIFDISDDDLCEIEENGNTGCGFICENFLDELITGYSLNNLGCVQVRIYAPNLGLFKGVLMKKKITSGAKIQLPPSMKKVGASKAAKKMQPLMLINNAGIDPSKTASIVKRLHCIDPSGDGGPKEKGEKPKILTKMIRMLMIGLGVPEKIVSDYTHRSRDKWSEVQHVYLRGVADPTGKIPPAHVYVAGIKNQNLMNALEKNQLFVTRIPVVKCCHSKMVHVTTKKPDGMSNSEFEWLESQPLGTLIFGTPSKGKLPLSEVLDGDMDGDRFFGM